MYYLGVDGGGTKTAFSLIDNKGNIIKTLEKGTCHYMQIGLDGFKDVIENGINEICTSSNISIKDIKHTFLGIPGYGEVEKYNEISHGILLEIFKNSNFTLGNDVVAGWAGSLACKSGINLVAGTGAIAFGVNENLKDARTSGWGCFCGDEGSAYWIGKKAIELFTKESDHRIDKSIIYNIFKEDLNLKEDFDLLTIIQEKYKYSRTEIAKLSMIVYKAAKNGDEKAIKIFEDAAEELYLMVMGIINQLEFKNTTLISYSGGVFKSGDLILNPLKEKIKNLNCKLIEPKLSPVTGSALYAYKLSGNTITEEIINNLISQESKLI